MRIRKGNVHVHVSTEQYPPGVQKLTAAVKHSYYMNKWELAMPRSESYLARSTSRSHIISLLLLK